MLDLDQVGKNAGTAMGSICCEHCTAVCCHYLALPLDPPETSRDFDDIRWYLMHKGVSVFIEDGDWYIQLPTVCENLRPDNLCGIYDRRPKICREYKAGECDYAGGAYGYELLLQCEQDLLDYLESKRAAQARKRTKTSRSKKGRKGTHARRKAS
jgi:Fe-S-cluster containining protein